MPKHKSLLLFFFLMLNFLFLAMICIYNNYNISLFMPMLPVTYILMTIFVYKHNPYLFKFVSTILLLVTNFIRMVFNPCILVIANYYSNVPTNAGLNHLNDAILLLIFEYICTGVFLIVSKKVKYAPSQYTMNKEETSSNQRVGLFVKLSISFLVIIALVCVTLDKTVLYSITTIFYRFTVDDATKIADRTAYLNMKENSSLLYNLFYQDIYYLQILIPAFLISYVYKKNVILSCDANPNKKGFVTCLIISIMSVVIVTESNADSVCILLSCLIVLYYIYKSQLLRIMPLVVGGFFSFTFLFLLAKSGLLSNGSVQLGNISSLLNSYFSGLPDVSVAFNMEYEDKLATFFGDVVAGIPYAMVFFKGYPKSVVIFNEVAYGFSGKVTYVMPVISYGYHYFGVFAPIITLIEYSFAFKFEEKFKTTNSVFNKILYGVMLVNMAVAPCIWGFPNAIKRVCHYIPLIMLAYVNEKPNRTNH